MRISVGSDADGPLTEALLTELTMRGCEILRHGALREPSTAWASIGRAVAIDVARGDAELGIVCCWTGTGISIAANKIAGVRAALCVDAQTAMGARRWNDANVLALSLRLTSPAVGLEILEAFLSTPPSDREEDQVEIAAIEGGLRT
jgi:ribose 5-phosphate isomerase B